MSPLFSKGREGGHADAVDDPFKKFENLYAGTLCVFVLGGLKRTSYYSRSYDDRNVINQTFSEYSPSSDDFYSSFIIYVLYIYYVQRRSYFHYY